MPRVFVYYFVTTDLVYAKRVLNLISGKNKFTADFQYLGVYTMFYARKNLNQTFPLLENDLLIFLFTQKRT